MRIVPAHRARPWLLVAGVLLACSCSLGETPRQAAQGYLEALESLDFVRAAEFTTLEGQTTLRALKPLFDGLSVEEQAKFRVSDWSITEESQAGDTATVFFVFDKVKKGELWLRRIQGVWKVEHRSSF